MPHNEYYFVCRICSHDFRSRDVDKYKIRETPLLIKTDHNTPRHYTGICDDCQINGKEKLDKMYGSLMVRTRRDKLKGVLNADRSPESI